MNIKFRSRRGYGSWLIQYCKERAHTRRIKLFMLKHHCQKKTACIQIPQYHSDPACPIYLVSYFGDKIVANLPPWAVCWDLKLLFQVNPIFCNRFDAPFLDVSQGIVYMINKTSLEEDMSWIDFHFLRPQRGYCSSANIFGSSNENISRRLRDSS